MPSWGEILEELNHRVKSNPGLAPFDTVRRKYLAALSALTKRNTILYATKWTAPEEGQVGQTSITPEDIQGFMEVVHGLSGDNLDLILHSPGGSPEATEAIVNYLRSKFSDIRVFVPQAAMSAATMLSMASDRIVLGKHSSLGPIDPQMVMATEHGVRAIAAHAILEQFELAKKECQADPTLLPSWLPMLRQYGPALIIQCKLAVELSQTLVRTWLEKYMFAKDGDAAAKATKIASHLANHANFKSHSRYLSRDHIRGLGIVVEDLEADQKLQDAVLSVFHAATHTMAAAGAVKIIENHQGKAFIKSQQNFTLMQAKPPPLPIAAPKGFPFPGA